MLSRTKGWIWGLGQFFFVCFFFLKAENTFDVCDAIMKKTYHYMKMGANNMSFVDTGPIVTTRTRTTPDGVFGCFQTHLIHSHLDSSLSFRHPSLLFLEEICVGNEGNDS